MLIFTIGHVEVGALAWQEISINYIPKYSPKKH